MGAAVGGVSGALSFFLFFFMGVLGAAPEPSASAKRLRSRSPDWDGSGEIGRMEVVVAGGGRALRAYFVRDRCVCHDLDRSHAEFKPDETKKKKKKKKPLHWKQLFFVQSYWRKSRKHGIRGN